MVNDKNIDPQIYQPAEDSYLLQKYVQKYALGRVLDLGTGSGIQALTAIKNLNCKEVVAVDINENVVDRLNAIIKERKLRKIKTFQSDLFSNIKGHFNLIIFNPPYLPQDKDITDQTIYGGKKGWEISEKFFSQVSNYLFPDGKILFLFSSLTNKKKIDQLICHNLLEKQEIAKQKLAFEQLYVYEIRKSKLLRNLEKKGIENVHYFAQGKRGNIFLGELDKSKLVKTHFPKKNLINIAIKVGRASSQAEGRIANEIKWLKKLNKEKIGPKLLFYDQNYFAYKFVEGNYIVDWLRSKSKKEVENVLVSIIKQCFKMDQLRVNKEELHHPHKHILIDQVDNPVMLDFERCYKTKKPHNVTQFVEFICRLQKELVKVGFSLNIESLRKLAKKYKGEIGEENLENIINLIS